MRAFWKKYRAGIIFTGLTAFLIHREKLSGYLIGIDTEDLIRLDRDFYTGWLITGRQGLVLLKTLLGSLDFNPYFAGMMTPVFLTLALAAFLLLWERASGRLFSEAGRTGGIALFAGGVLWAGHPVLTEQLYFSLQSMEVCLGFSFVAAALYLTGLWQKRRDWRFPAGSFLLLLLVFSVYQAFVPFYIFGAVSVLLLQGLHRCGDREPVSGRELLLGILPYCGVFLGAFGANMLITGLFFSNSSYLQEQILWGSCPVTDNLRLIAAHLVKSQTGYDSVHYHFSYGILNVAALVLSTLYLFRRKRKGQSGGALVVCFFFLVSLLLTPYLMTFLCGGAPVVRSQLVLPAATGFLAWLDIRLWELIWRESLTPKGSRGRCITGVIVGFACLAGAWGQVQTTQRLYYTQRLCYEQDTALARELMEKIDRESRGEAVPVIVIGSRPFSGNNACLSGEVMGHSFFAYDVEVEPAFFWSTRRILGFMHTLGADYPQVEKERIPEAMEHSAYMPQWPAVGCVEQYEGMIIVKISP